MTVEAVPLAPMPETLVQKLAKSRFYDPAKLPKGYVDAAAMPAVAALETA
jgi:hypothetical protein